jgi:hypothetical protein
MPRRRCAVAPAGHGAPLGGARPGGLERETAPPVAASSCAPASAFLGARARPASHAAPAHGGVGRHAAAKQRLQHVGVVPGGGFHGSCLAAAPCPGFSPTGPSRLRHAARVGSSREPAARAGRAAGARGARRRRPAAPPSRGQHCQWQQQQQQQAPCAVLQPRQPPQQACAIAAAGCLDCKPRFFAGRARGAGSTSTPTCARRLHGARRAQIVVRRSRLGLCRDPSIAE